MYLELQVLQVGVTCQEYNVFRTSDWFSGGYMQGVRCIWNFRLVQWELHAISAMSLVLQTRSVGVTCKEYNVFSTADSFSGGYMQGVRCL